MTPTSKNIKIDSDQLRKVANHTLLNAYREIGERVSNAGRDLKKCSRMAGNDPVGTVYGKSYDNAAGGRVNGNGVIEAATLCANAAGAMRELMLYTAANYDNADDASIIDQSSTPGIPPAALRFVRIPNLPKAVGKGVDDPPGWDVIKPYTGSAGARSDGAYAIEWPNGDVAKLGSAALAWSNWLGCGILTVENGLSSTVSELRTYTSPEMSELTTAVSDLDKQVKEVSELGARMSTLSAQYGADLGSSQDFIRTTIADAIGVPSAELAIALAALAAGTRSFDTADEIRLTLGGAAITGNVKSLKTKADDLASSATSIGADVESVRAVLKPIVEQAPEVAKLVNSEKKDVAYSRRELRRPSLRDDVEDKIKQQATKVRINGYEYYVLDSDPRVKIPVDGKYHDPHITKIKQKVGYPDGKKDKFYDDGNGNWFPVDARWDYGHVDGSEWWRIREMAIDSNWTQEQVNAYANSSADLYRIEDRYTNRSHRDEQPREGQ